MGLKLKTHVAIPRYEKEGGEFDHGDVEWKSGDLFIAHPSKNTIEIVAEGDGKTSDFYHQCTISDAPQASGVVVPQGEKIVFVACRSANKVMWLDADGTIRNPRRSASAGPHTRCPSQAKRLP